MGIESAYCITQSTNGARHQFSGPRTPGQSAEAGAARPPSRQQLCRRMYGVLQRLYRKNRSRCAKKVLSGDWAKEESTTSLEEQESFWKPLFEGSSKPDDRSPDPVCEPLFEVSLPVDTEEYGRVLRSTHDSSPVWITLTGRFCVG